MPQNTDRTPLLRREEDIDIPSLRIFLVVSETCNMTVAAERLKLTQSAVSACIHRLEEAFDVRLFNRTSRPMHLTTYGRILRERAKEGLMLSERTIREMTSARRGENLNLRVGYSDSIGAIFGSYLAENLMLKVSHFSAYVGMTPRITQMLIEQKIDIGINTDLVGSEKPVQNIPVCTEKFLFVAPNRYHEELKTYRDITQLARKLPPIRYNKMCQSYIEIERLMRRLDVQYPSRIETDSNSMLLKMVGKGYGWSIIPVLAIEHAYREFKDVCFREIHLDGTSRTTNVIFRNPIYESLAEQIAKKMKLLICEQIYPHLQGIDPYLPKALCLH